MLTRNPRSVQTANGSANVMYVMITPIRTYWFFVSW